MLVYSVVTSQALSACCTAILLLPALRTVRSLQWVGAMVCVVALANMQSQMSVATVLPRPPPPTHTSHAMPELTPASPHMQVCHDAIPG